MGERIYHIDTAGIGRRNRDRVERYVTKPTFAKDAQVDRVEQDIVLSIEPQGAQKNTQTIGADWVRQDIVIELKPRGPGLRVREDIFVAQPNK